MGNFRHHLSLILAACALLHANAIAAFTPDQVLAHKQTVSSNGGAVTLNLHIFNPDGHQASESRPAIVFFFGGGWVSGSPSQFHPQCEYLASRGMVAISAEYRIRNTHGTTPQECVMDGKSAIRYVRENAAALGIDPSRIAAGGGSAGGHVAAATGTLSAYEEPGENLAISSRPDALILFNPVYDNGPGGYGHDTVKAYWEEFSPLHNISATTPPAIVFFGTNDPLVPVATAKNFKALMEAEGVRSDHHLYQDQSHGFFNDDVANNRYGYRATVFAMDEFLVSLGYLDDPHEDADPVTGWTTIFGGAGFSAGSETTASPITTDATADAIAAAIPQVNLADGDFIRLTGMVTIDAPLSGGNFRIGLFNGDAPVTPGTGSGYAGICAGAPATSDTSIVVGNGSSANHPFESAAGTTLGPIPAASATVPANTPIAFTLLIARNGNRLDLTARFSDGSSYHQEQNLLNQPLANYDYNRVAFLMSGNLNATQAAFSDIGITSGRVMGDVVIMIDDANAGRVGHVSTDPVGFGTGVNTATTNDAGIYVNGFQAHPVFVFQMTGVAAPANITNANFSVGMTEIVGSPNFNTDAHVIRKDASSAILASDYEATTQLLMSGFNESGDGVGTVSLDAAGQSTLGMWLKNNWADGEYVFIGLQTDPLVLPTTGITHVYRYGTNAATPEGWKPTSTDARLTIDVSDIASAPVVLEMVLNNGALDFVWNNNIGKLYDLESTESLTFSDWAVYNGYTNMARDVSGTNTLNGVATDGPVRFFRVKEKN